MLLDTGTTQVGSLDFYDAAEKIGQLIASDQDAAVGLRKYFRFCEKHFPGSIWEKLGKLDLQADLAQLADWLRDALLNEPPRRVTAFWFGLFNPYVDGHVTCALYVAGSSKYRPDVEVPDCFVQPTYFPERRYAASRVLAETYRLATRGKMAKTSEVEYFGCLGFAAIAVAHLMQTVDRRLLLGQAAERAVVVGFDSGDMLEIGSVRRSGFVSHFTHRPTVPEIVATPSPRHFYEIVDDGRGRWWLEEPWLAAVDDLPVGFATTGKPLSIRRPLKSAIMATPKGAPVDFTFAVLDTPIVTERAGRILRELAPGSVQRLPVQIRGQWGRYDVLNVLDVVDCLDMRKSEIVSFDSASWDVPDGEERPIGTILKMVIDGRRAKGHEIFLLSGARRHIIVSRRIKERLEAERVTGIQLKSV
jgi:hypothetical protein